MNKPNTASAWATVRSLRSRLARQTKVLNANREFGLQQMRLLDQMKDNQVALVNKLVIALLALDTPRVGEVGYFVKTRLEDELIALHPGVAGRLGRLKSVSTNQAADGQ